MTMGVVNGTSWSSEIFDCIVGFNVSTIEDEQWTTLYEKGDIISFI